MWLRQLEESTFSKVRALGQGLVLPGSKAVLSVNKASLQSWALVFSERRQTTNNK